MLNNRLQVLIPDLSKNKSVFDLLGASKMDVWKASSREAYADSPSISSLFDPENLRYLSDPEFADIRQMASDPEFADIRQMAIEGRFDKPRITKEEFEAKYGNTRLQYDPNFTDEKIQDILKRDKQREINEYIISRGKGGLVEAVGKFGVEAVASNLSPINIASSFIPIGGQARWAAAALKYGAGKTALAKGFVSGAVGQAAIEPFLYRERNFEQREYAIKDSFVNILQSGLFGSTLHGLGYSAKQLKSKYFSNAETLASEITTNHPIVDNEFKANIESVLSESDPKQLSFEFYKDAPTFNLAELQTAKFDLITKAESNFPQYFEQYKKLTTLEQALHEQFYTNNKIDAIPAHLQEMLQTEKAKLQHLKEQYINDPSFQEYLETNKALDETITNHLRQEQFDLKAYDLSQEDLYIARSQLDEGKHINLETPENAESFYENSGKQYELNLEPAKNSNIGIAEQLTSLENEISILPENYKAEYSKDLMIDQEVISLIEETAKKIKNSANKKEIEPLLNHLKLYDEELAGNLRSVYKQHVGEIKLAPLELNKTLEQIAIDCANKSFLRNRDNALNLIKLANAENFVRKHKNKLKGISEILRQADLRQVATERELIFSLTRDLEKSELMHIFTDKNFEHSIAQELWNITHPNKIDTASPKAKEVASIIHKHQTMAINRANLSGSHIIPLEGYITKRTHNTEKIKKAGFAKWQKFIEPLLDTQKTGDIDLKQIFNNLATATHLKDLDEYLTGSFNSGNSKNIADRLSANRKLHFKTANDELKYLYEFGNYSAPNIIDKVLNPLLPEKSFLAESIISNLSKLGKSIGVLETMGSKPQQMLDNLRNGFIAELQEKATINIGFFSELEGLKRSNKFDSRLELMLGVRPEIPQVNKILDSYRSWKCISNLGSTIISSIPDVATFVSELQNNGVPILESYSSIFKVFANSKEKKEVGKLLGIMSDSLLGGAYSRLSPEGNQVTGSISKLTNAFFKLNFMEWWDNSWKSSMGNLLSHNLAINVTSSKSFSGLYKGLQTLLNRYNINESNWHLYKNLVQNIEGNKYIIPDVNLLPDNVINQHLRFQGKTVNDLNRTRLKQEITNNLQRYLIDRVDTAVPTAHTLEKSVMQLAGLGVKPGSPMAAVVKCLMQFKTFAYSYVARPLKALTLDQIPVHEQRGYGMFDKGTWQDVAQSLKNPTTLKILPQLLLGTTTLGYLSLNASRLLHGEEPLAPTESGVFTASVLKGGGLGLYGDFIFGEYDRYRHNLLESLSGPIGGDVIDIGKIYSKALSGDPKAVDLTASLLKRNIPGRNLFYLTPALFTIEKHYK